MDSRSLCNLVAGCSGQMLGFRCWYFLSGESCAEYTCILFQRKHQSFQKFVLSGGDHYPPDRRYSCFPGRDMVFIAYSLCSSHTPSQEWHQTDTLWWLSAGILQGIITGLLLVNTFWILIYVSCLNGPQAVLSTGPLLPWILSQWSCSSNNVHGSECRTDEYHDLPSAQEFIILFGDSREIEISTTLLFQLELRAVLYVKEIRVRPYNEASRRNFQYWW